MKKKSKTILLILYILIGINYNAQSGWVWTKGSNSSGAIGNYGTKGVANSSNEMPSRYQGAYWTDLNGKFWLFGGINNNGFYNDLWRFDPITNNWTWIKGDSFANSAGNYGTKGVSSINNNPPARCYGANCWTDKDNNLWLFGGYGNTYFNDLWKYNITTNHWTWVSGDNCILFPNPNAVHGTVNVSASTNNPGGRDECKSGWVYNNKLILFGGNRLSYLNHTNDIWEYNIASNLWTWIGGMNTLNLSGSYGSKNVTSTSNFPGSRSSYTKWKNGSKLYIFGGSSHDASNNYFTYNDLWEFDLVSKLWTWIGGDSVKSSNGTYNSNCDTNFLYPMGRYENQSVQINNCKSIGYTFGGATTVGSSMLNDFWYYDFTKNKFTLINGGSKFGNNGSYGTKGAFSSSNYPPLKYGVHLWIDSFDRMWMFGGWGVGTPPYANDMWVYTPDTNCVKYSALKMLSSPSKINLGCYNDSSIIILSAKPDSIKIIPNTNYTIASDSLSIKLKPIATTSYKIVTYGGNCLSYKDSISFTLTKQICQTICDTSRWLGYINYLSNPQTKLNASQYIDSPNSWSYVSPSLASNSYYWTGNKFKDTLCITSNFSLEIRMKVDASTGISAYDTRINISTSGGDCWAQLMGASWGQPWTSLGVMNTTVLSNHSSLIFPSLGTWARFKMKFENNQLKYYVNDTIFYTGSYTGNICNIYGLDYTFKGSGYVDWIKIRDNRDTIVWQEDFNGCSSIQLFPDLCNTTYSLNISNTLPTCTSDTLKLFATTTPSLPQITYTWTGPNGFTSTLPNPKIPNPTSGNLGKYICTAKLNECTNVKKDSFSLSSVVLDTIRASKDTNICQGNSYMGKSTTGIHKFYAKTVANCDSMFTLTLTVNSRTTSTISQTICQGDSFLGRKVTGTFIDTLKNANSKGCDSIRTLNLTVNPNTTSNTTQAICTGQSFWGYTITGVYRDTFRNANSKGCDSIRILNLTASPNMLKILTITQCNAYFFKGQNRTTTGTYRDTIRLSSGCDSITELQLTIPVPTSMTIDTSACDSFRFKSRTYKINSNILDTIKSSINCDSIYKTIRLTIHKATTLPKDSLTACKEIEYNGQKYYKDTLLNIRIPKSVFPYCDSLWKTAKLRVFPLPNAKLTATPDTLVKFGETINLTASGGILYQWNISSLTTNQISIPVQSRTYIEVKVIDHNQCDSTVGLWLDNLPELNVTEVFSPNGDGKNDHFSPTIKGNVIIHSWRIFNRWGQKIFESNNLNQGWDGKFKGQDQPQGSYVYQIEYTLNNVKTIKTGAVTLIR